MTSMLTGRIAMFAASAVLLAACETSLPGAAPADGAQPMAQPQASQSGGDVPPAPASLNSEERVIWNSLTVEAKRQAADYIANGGTLTQFVAL